VQTLRYTVSVSLAKHSVSALRSTEHNKEPAVKEAVCVMLNDNLSYCIASCAVQVEQSDMQVGTGVGTCGRAL
jgi:hypothetical protein